MRPPVAQARPREINEKLIGHQQAAAKCHGQANGTHKTARNPACSQPRRKIAHLLYHSIAIVMRLPCRHDDPEAVVTARAFAVATFAIMMALGLRSPASAQAYPVKPIHIIVPFAAGGITDVIGRAWDNARRALGSAGRDREQAGRGIGRVGTESVARSAPTATRLVTADATFVTSPHTYSKLPSPINDFVPVTGLGISPRALVVHPSLPVRTLAGLVDYAGRDQASSIMEPSALDRADISTSFCWKA
jgi:hypothetical protein